MKKFQGSAVVGVVIGLVVAAFVGVTTFLVIDGNNKATNYDNYDFYSVIAPDDANGQIGDHIKSYDPDTDKFTDDPTIASKAPLIIYEYADFQCPGCASINPRINQAIEEAEGNLAVVYRNYLLSYHQNGTAAASAAEAAGLQGYWKPYADKLFSEQSEWEYASGSERTALFNKYFTEVTDGKGNLDQFNADLASANVSKKISFDMGIGKRIDLAGTPAFYVDGQLIAYGNKSGGSIVVKGETYTWDTAMTGEEFKNFLVKVANAAAKSTDK